MFWVWQGVSNSLLNDRLASQRSERLEAEKAREKTERDRLQAENAKNEVESARYKAEKARDKAESEVEKVYDSLDEELTALQRQVNELSRANEIKEYENQALRAKLAQIDEKPVLLQGEEEKLYGGYAVTAGMNDVQESIQDVKGVESVLIAEEKSQDKCIWICLNDEEKIVRTEGSSWDEQWCSF